MHHQAIRMPEISPPDSLMALPASSPIASAASEPSPPIPAIDRANPSPNILLTRTWSASFGSSRMTLSGEPERARLLVGHVNLHLQERGREGLALRVGHERERAAASERLVQEEVERAEVRQLEALDAAFDHPAEMLLDAPGRDLAREHRVELFAQRDEPDVGRVALVARARVREFHKFDSHGSRVSLNPRPSRRLDD